MATDDQVRDQIVSLKADLDTAMAAVRVVQTKIQKAELRLEVGGDLTTSGKAALESAAGM
jgi:hypothetical protein